MYSIKAIFFSIVYFVFSLAKNIYKTKKNKKNVFSKINLLFDIYISILIIIVIKYVDIPIQGDSFPPNIIPFIDIFEAKNFNSEFFINIILKNYIGNILIFIPLGFFLAYKYNIKEIKNIIIIGFFVSLTIELGQLISLFSYSMFDIDDLILNTLGCYWGYYVYIFLLKKYKHNKDISVNRKLKN